MSAPTGSWYVMGVAVQVINTQASFHQTDDTTSECKTRMRRRSIDCIVEAQVDLDLSLSTEVSPHYRLRSWQPHGHGHGRTRQIRHGNLPYSDRTI